MKHQQAAVALWGQGKHRESANEYWLSFQAFPSLTHEMRYWIFHGYTSILREVCSEANDNDFSNLRKIFEDKNELRLLRMEAGFTLGVLHYSRSERFKCEDVYHRSKAIGEKTAKKKQEKHEQKMMMIVKEGVWLKSPIMELMEGVLKDCQDNLNGLNRATTGIITHRPEVPSKTHRMPVRTGGTTLTNDEINNLIDVGGIQCDCCKKRDVQLFTCAICDRTSYCSKKCQTNQWKENGHKKYCRKEGVFKPGDLVQIARLKNKPELNDTIVRLIGPDTTSEGRYKLQIVGGVKGDKVMSVSAKNLNQLRPFDCRN